MEPENTSSQLQQSFRIHITNLSVTFLDLKNAFGSEPHQDMMAHIKLLVEVRAYISTAYYQWTVRVVTQKLSNFQSREVVSR